MKYEELLKQATPLPWMQPGYDLIGADGRKIIIGDVGLGLGSCSQWPQARANGLIFRHSANVLPKALEALKAIHDMLNQDDEKSYVADDREGAIATAFGTAKEAIAAIETVGA